MITANENTFYQPGETFLHCADPRLKLCLSLLVVVVAFAAGNGLQLLVLLLVLAFMLWRLAPLPASFWRLCWMLRWLLLFTLLMHLLFTDGRTLMGVSWLSLDGLYKGLQVSLQMLLAVVVAAILSLTTSVEELVAAVGWVVSPLKWLGCKTDEWQKTLSLTIRFVPVVRDEMSSVANADGEGEVETESNRASRWTFAGCTLKSFVDGLLIKGDKVAHELALDSSVNEISRLPALLPLTLQDRLLLGGCVTLLCVYWILGL